MRKPIILYIAPTRRDAELFLRTTLFQIKNELVLKTNFSTKTIETKDYIVKAIAIADYRISHGLYPIKYFLQSECTFEMRISLISPMFFALQTIKDHFLPDTKEITLEQMINILNGDSEHCADFTEPECCCEFWERKEDGSMR
mgnify:CR=1 FL=1